MDEMLQTPVAAPEAEVDEKLMRVFKAAFPELARADLPTASADTVGWDSLQSLLLMTLLEEEFGVRIPATDVPDLSSYNAARTYMLDRSAE